MGEIVVAIATRERPRSLNRLLSSVEWIKLPSRPVRVIVVDNDPGQSARSVFDARCDYRFPMEYIWEPRLGIPFARNAALDAALPAEFLVFVDDDESVSTEWLVELEGVMDLNPSAAAVTGSVRSCAPPDTPDWFFDSPLYRQAGTTEVVRVSTAATGNVILRMSQMRHYGLRFDESFPLLGGSDSDFFHRLSSLGAVIFHNPGSLVFEYVSPERTRLWWMLKRGFRGGYHPAVRRIARAPLGARSVELVRGSYRLFDGFLSILTSLWRGRPILLRGLVRTASGIGAFAAVLGFRYSDYRTVDGE